jgi:dihydrofolate reductase / thymidylate synthase
MGISSHGMNSKHKIMNAVVMGRATWESIPSRFRPLSGRVNVVLSRNTDYSVPAGVVLANSLQQAMQKLNNDVNNANNVGTIFVIGGANIYEQAVREGFVSRVIYTQVDNIPDRYKFDVFFPELPSEQWTCRPFCNPDKENGSSTLSSSSGDENEQHVDEKSGLIYRFLEYIRKPEPASTTTTTSSAVAVAVDKNDEPHEELQYLNLCREIITSGVKRGDRTGTGTLSRFGTQMRFSLRNGRLPLLTTKRTFWRGVAEELLWFISVRFFIVLDVMFQCLRCYTHVLSTATLNRSWYDYREVPMRMNWQPRIFTFGMAMVRASFWTNVVCSIVKSEIWVQSMGINGDTLGPR